MSEPIFKITIEAHGDLDDEKPGAQSGVIFDADFLGMDVVRHKQPLSFGATFKLFRSMVEAGRKVLGF